ncbi:4Fe-4S binding protein [Desulfosudis oleivorans]|uniref:4Fe-4S ferredoxin iron-sulfur binding domain protein n=1 Tax=Desulfosudis oleivorans (strain DSM 6200 / JCM 39069 / Hxd3) TaxID=96561 RepID=A8ZSZ3_DESOH|nr:4Fe-4S binding protein [Desulfosudis oleivorans]ABW66157.1 4Fe-4S ferredoxin iron-sulfur binding domain protein [Desulfosudis oleivorans Hxd3]
MNQNRLFKRLRQACQLLFLALFLALFRLTDYSGADTIPYAVNIFFRWDPLVAASVMLAGRAFIFLLLPSLAVIGLTLVFGRVFCGWICPLGTLIDAGGKVIQPVRRTPLRWRAAKYMVLTAVLVSAAFGVQWVGFVDPFALLVRGLTIAVDPMLNAMVAAGFDAVYFHGPSWAVPSSEAVYDVFRDFILPYKQSRFLLPFFTFFMLAAIFAMELLGRRFWCRTLCPLGAMLALVSRFSFFRRIPLSSCKGCDACRQQCRMDAFTENREMMAEECSLCMDCLDFCPRTITTFRFSRPVNKTGPDLGRRHLLAAGLAGLALPFLSRIDAAASAPLQRVIRPPGALVEEDFLKTCVRCGECMKVCIQNALQPVFLEQGVEAMFTPKLLPRLGYCEFNCTLCGQVCPTGAISRLTLDEKHAFVMGRAVIDKNRCLPFARSVPCIVCEEHCPTHDKAIRFETVQAVDTGGNTVTLKRPYVVEALCVGCGICETVCPVAGRAAIYVVAEKRGW